MSDFQKVLNKLLNGKWLHQPFSTRSEFTSYRDDIEDRFENFINRIYKFKNQGNVESYFFEKKSEMKEVCSILLNVIDAYLKGNAGEAYDKIDDFFNAPIIRSNLRFLIRTLKSNHLADGTQNLYRVRCSDLDLKRRGEMFHIPFDKRERVGTQRYSIAGLPCLYLGTSLYVCWQEMGKPELNRLYLSRIKPVEEVGVLNLAYSLETLRESTDELFSRPTNEDNIEEQTAFIVLFPLLMACTYNRKFSHANFHEEYIVPNLLLQWISKEKSIVSGISYFSTKTKQLRHHNLGVNYVFPPNRSEVQTVGFCPELSRNFHLSKPVSWQLLSTINNSQKVVNDKFVLNDDLDEDMIRNYRLTKFYEMETMIDQLVLDKV